MDEAGHCKDCKFWKNHEPGYSGMACKHPDLRAWAACDGEEAHLQTEPDFGCIQFEAA
jgi:hypothetical protein